MISSEFETSFIAIIAVKKLNTMNHRLCFRFLVTFVNSVCFDFLFCEFFGTLELNSLLFVCFLVRAIIIKMDWLAGDVNIYCKQLSGEEQAKE
jgi:hypothetical protein